MSIISSDAFTGANWTPLTTRSGEIGATWSKNGDTPSTSWYLYGNRVICRGFGAVYTSAVPVSADYTVSATIRILSTVTDPVDANIGIAGRMSTSADTYYALYYQAGETVLIKRIAGVTSPALDIWTSTLSTSTNYTFALEMVGTDIKGYVNDIERVSVSDASIASTGRGGLRANGINDYNTGNHIDNFAIEDTASDLVFRSYSVPIIGL